MNIPDANPRIVPVIRRPSFALAHELGHYLLASQQAYRELIDNSMEAHVPHSVRVVVHFAGPAAQDYSHVRGNVTRTSPPTVKITDTASPVVIGSAEDSGDGSGGEGGGGSGGSGEEGGDGDGDGEPPISAGPAAGGDGQHPILLLLICLLLVFSILRDILVLPFKLLLKVLRWLYKFVPSPTSIWICGKYLFPDRVRKDIYVPDVWSMRRDRRRVRRRRLPFRLWIGFCLRLRTVVLFGRCVKATLKEAGIEKGALPDL